MTSPDVLSVRTRLIKFVPYNKNHEENDVKYKLRNPMGKIVIIELEDVQPCFDLVVRRKLPPSSDKWKAAMRVPQQILLEKKLDCQQKQKQGFDEFGSRVGQIHVSRETAVDSVRPGVAMRTALTGKRKTGNERTDKKSLELNSKRRIRSAGGKFGEQARSACHDEGITPIDNASICAGDPLVTNSDGPQLAKTAKRLRLENMV